MKIYEEQARSSICAVNGRQTVMQKDSIEALLIIINLFLNLIINH